MQFYFTLTKIDVITLVALLTPIVALILMSIGLVLLGIIELLEGTTNDNK